MAMICRLARGLLLVGCGTVWLSSATAEPVRAQPSTPPDTNPPPHPLRPGTYLVSGTAAVYRHRDIGNNIRSAVVEAHPVVARLVTPHLMLGIRGGVRVITPEEGARYVATAIGPTVGWYFGAAPDKLLPFVNGAVVAERDRFGGASTTVGTDRILRGAGGLTYLVNPHVGLTGEAFYQHRRTRRQVTGGRQENSAELYGTRLGLTIFLY